MTSFEEALRSRYSCRQFLKKPVPRGTIEKVLGTAQLTPSWCNTQPWQVILLSGTETDRLRDTLYAHAAGGDRRKVCGVQLYQAVGIGKEDRGAAGKQALENFNFFDAPHVLLITTPENLGVYGAVDCGLYVSSFILAAREHGVDTIAQAALASYPDLLRDYFQLPPERKFVCGIAFGYGDREHAINTYRTERADLSDVVDWRG